MISRVLKEEEKLFHYMHFARKKSKMIERYAIYLIGQIRSGKSTTFNWIINPESILGKKSDGTIHYTRREGLESQDTLQNIKDSFVSVSLIPNMKVLRNKQTYFSLIDLPGFHDSRTSSQRMLVNFINNTCFSQTENAKFILVISEADFIHPTGLGLANTIKEFVKLVKLFPTQERAKVFQSVGMLITSVNFKDYKEAKQDHLDALSYKLYKIKEMTDYGGYFSLMQELVQSIIKDKRIELFELAKNNLSPLTSTLIEDFNSCGWTFYDFKHHKENISYPYQQYYQSLRPEEQDKIRDQISLKIRQFQEIQRCMASIIGNYLKGLKEQKSYNQENDQIFLQLEKILCRNRVEHRQRQILQKKQRKNIAPLRIYKNILSLLDITYQIQDDKERSIEKQKIHYLTYLEQYFEKSIRIFSQSFTSTQRNHQVIQQLTEVFLEVMEELKYIVQIDRNLASEYRRLKESIQIMNGVNLSKEQIQLYFVAYLKTEHFEDLEGQQQVLDQIIAFLIDLNWIDFNIQDQFFILRNVYHAKGVLMFHTDKQKSLQYYLNCLVFNLKLYLLHFREEDSCRMSRQYQQKMQNLQIKHFFEETMQEIFVLMFLKHKPAIVKIIETHKFYFLMKDSFKKLQKFFEGKTINQLLKDYGSYYLEGGYYSHAIELFKKIQRNSKNDRTYAQKMLQNIKIKKIENKQNVFIQYQYYQNIEQLIQIINKIYEIATKDPVKYSKMNILQEFTQLSKIKKQKLNENQFEYPLQQTISQSDIITISRQLIQKIKNRKVILMLGKHVGKTCAFFWLQNKGIVCKQFGSNKYIYDLSSKKPNDNRINHRGFRPTFIPNIGCIQDEVLIDFPNIFEKKIINVMIKLDMLSAIVQNSKEIKFLLVVKQEDLTKAECASLFEMFTFLLHLLPKKNDLYRHFLLMISHSTCSNEKAVKESLRNFSLEFGKDQTSLADYNERFEQKYGIKIQDKQIYKEILDYFAQSSIIFFQKASKHQQNISFNFQEFNKKQENWIFLESSVIKTVDIFSWIDIVHKQQKQIAKIKQMIMSHLKTAKYLASLISFIIANIVKQEKLEQSFLQQKVGRQFIEKWKATEATESKILLPQLITLNKIFTMTSLIQFFRSPTHFTNQPIAQVNSLTSYSFELIKKLATGSKDYLILASWASNKLKQLLTIIQFIEHFKRSLPNYQIEKIVGQELSCFHYLVVDNIPWTDDDYERFKGTIVTLFRKMNLKNLTDQMVETKMNASEDLLRLIHTLQKIQNWDTGLLQKWKELVNIFESLSQKEGNPLNQLYSQIVLFEQYKKIFQIKNDQLEYKFCMLKLIARTTIISAPYYQQFGLKICKMLKCQKTFQRFIDQLAKKNNQVEFLRHLLDLSLLIGYSQKYYQLFNTFEQKSENESEKSCYRQNRNQIVKKQTVKMKVSFDNMQNYTVQDLENICEEIKQFWQEKSKK